MKCCKCGESITDTTLSFYPVEPIGTKDRDWMCEECLRYLPEKKRTRLLKRGTTRCLRLKIVILVNKLLDGTDNEKN